MSQKRLWDLLEVGMALQQMKSARAGWRVFKETLHTLDEPLAGKRLSQLSQFLEEVRVADPGERLQQGRTRLNDLLTKWERRQMRSVDGDAERLKKLARYLMQYLEPETLRQTVFVTTQMPDQARAYAEQIDREFGDVWGQLPNIAREDLREASRCLAFNAPTAAACVTVRATEAALRCYFCAITCQPLPKKREWAPLIDQLREFLKVAEKEHHATWLLRTIGSDVRNPAMHPQETYDLSKATVLLQKCQLAIQVMAEDLEKHGKTIADGWALAFGGNQLVNGTI